MCTVKRGRTFHPYVPTAGFKFNNIDFDSRTWRTKKYQLHYGLLIIISSYLHQTEAIKANLNLPRSLSTPTNRIIDVTTSCTAHKFSMNITMEKPFKGVIFAKDFPLECRSLG